MSETLLNFACDELSEMVKLDGNKHKDSANQHPLSAFAFRL